MKWKYKEALTDGTAIRIVFEADDNSTVAVVKYFDPVQQENNTVKFFNGNYEKVKSHWKTQKPIPVSKLVVQQAAKHAAELAKAHEGIEESDTTGLE